MPTIVTLAQRRAAKHQLLADLQEGSSVLETHARSAIPWHPATIYRLRKRLHADPDTALDDGRHGHPIKLRGEVCDWPTAPTRAASGCCSPCCSSTLLGCGEPPILRSYTGTGLALLSKRQQVYSYRHTERFLAQVACATEI